ncbi:cysteine-rich VLP domain-containing protein [Wukongibacter sp. M2B1]|uniref:cysteine-rich VLP domain-containing protein n=1 Tax=Wukongibacter sp. M2B1 TaxID=3088895 RepID=UPI003D78E4E9
MGQERLSGKTAKEQENGGAHEKEITTNQAQAGRLPTPHDTGTAQTANALIRATCCNYDNSNCLLLDDGEECVCVQSISYDLCCTWFCWAVLPQNKPLETELFYKGNRKQKNASDRKRRGKADN